MYGSLVIRQPKNKDVHAALYDYDLPEHVIITTDWIHESGAAKYASHFHSNGTNKPDTILVNGLKPTELQWQDGKKYYTPVAHFDVKQVNE